MGKGEGNRIPWNVKGSQELSGALKYPVFQCGVQGESKHPGGNTLKPGIK